MKNKILTLLLLIILTLTLSGCGVAKAIKNILHFGEENELYYGVTAKQWLPLIETKAKEWRSDSYFYGISEAEVKMDGSSDKWQYLYYSPGSEKSIVFIYESGFISTKELVLPPLNPVRSFEIDSPTALNVALEKSKDFMLNNNHVTIIMSLVGPAYESGRGLTQWLIKFYGNTGSLNILVDASTGKIIKIF